MSERFPKELWDDPAFHKGREWGRMEREAGIIKLLKDKITCDWKQDHCEACDQTDYLISLIRKENNE